MCVCLRELNAVLVVLTVLEYRVCMSEGADSMFWKF